ncbi:hypothetical protein MHYP_G00013760 [Metynnis hypsauchen]
MLLEGFDSTKMLHRKDGQTSATYFSWLRYDSALELWLLQPGNSEAFVPSVMGPDEEPFEERYRSAVRKKRVPGAPLGGLRISSSRPACTLQVSTVCQTNPRWPFSPALSFVCTGPRAWQGLTQREMC